MSHTRHRDDPGAKLGMWLFLFSELLLFGRVGHRRETQRTDRGRQHGGQGHDVPRAAADRRSVDGCGAGRDGLSRSVARRGVLLSSAAAYFPPLWSVESGYGYARAEASTYVPLPALSASLAVRGGAVLLVTHDSAAVQAAHRAVCLREGKLTER